LQQLESLPAMVAAIYSDEPATQLEATTQFRKLLSIGVLMLIWDSVFASLVLLRCTQSVIDGGFVI